MPRLRCFSLLVVSLLVPLASSTQQKSMCTPDDATNEREMICFANNNCVYQKSNPNDKLVENDDNITCGVNVEIRPYSKKQAFIRLKTKKPPIKLSYQDPSVEIFGCEENGGSIRMTGPDTKGIKFIHGKKWETGIMCEFLYTSSLNDLFDPAKALAADYGDGKVTIPKKTFGFEQASLESATKCDIDWLKYDFDKDSEQFAYEEPNKYFSNVDCSKGDLVFADNDKDVEAAKFECTKDTSGGWDYTITKKDSSTPIPTEKKHVNVGCRLQVCKMCEALPPCSGDSCNGFKKGEKDGCSILTCDTPFIKINDDDKPTETRDVNCTKNPDAGADDGPHPISRWTFDGKNVSKVECIKTVACHVLNPLELDPTRPEDTKGLDLTKSLLKCPDGRNITYEGGDPTTKGTTATIDCEGKTGKWKAKGTIVPKGAIISCQAPESTTGAVAGASVFGPLEYAAIAIGALVIIAVVAIVIFCFTCKKRLDKRTAARKIKTITSGRTTKSEDGLKTAVPVGFVPPPSSEQKVEPELIEKTTIAQTPEKPRSAMMKTAILNTTATTQDQDREPYDVPTEQTFGPPKKLMHLRDLEKEKSNGSEPRSIKIGENGELLDRKKVNRSKEPPKSDDRSGEKSKTDDAGTTKKEDKKEEKKEPPKPVEITGPQPQVFALNEKEEKIRKGATRKQADYPTLDDVMSDWSDYDEAYRKGDVEGYLKRKEEKERKRRRALSRASREDRNKTVPTAVTPDQPHSVERTQATKTRNTVDKADKSDMENLLTQMDTTLEQKEIDNQKK